MRRKGMGHILAVGLALGLVLTACQASGTTKGALGGAALGAGAGYLIGDSAGAAAAGGLAGGVLGGVMGNQHDKISELKEGQAQQAERNNTRVVNVQNANGSVTPVMLRLVGVDQWQGPRGEIYNGLPSPSQLQSVYGL